MAAPIVVSGTPKMTGLWSHGLFGCFDNVSMSIIACFVPCVTFGQTAEAMGRDCCLYGCVYLFFCPFGWLLEARQRGQIRRIRGIPGSVLGDACLICFCSYCTLIQEGQEVEGLKREAMTVVQVTVSPSGAQQYAAAGGGYNGPGYVQYVPPGNGMEVDQKMTRQ